MYCALHVSEGKRKEPHCCDSKGEKVYEKVFLSSNNYIISLSCGKNVIHF